MLVRVVACASLVIGSGAITVQAQSGVCAPPVSNPVLCENTQTGTPQSTWDITGSGDPSIQGFATDMSYNKGATVSFKISTDASTYTIDIYRVGYYQGNGARKITSISPSAHLPQNQPACLNDVNTGLVDCGNWAVSASWTIPTSAVSGVYFARLRRTDTGGASHIVFVVRDDSSTADILLQTDDTTWQAYNQYGGTSLYMGNGPGTGSQAGRAFKVSYNRPFATRGQSASGYGPSNFLFYAEYPMIRWLEANGYNLSYFSGLDTDRNGALIKNHKVFMSVGHDEYWSAGARANVEAARDAGVNLAFFSGNEVYWKTRWEPSTDGSSTPNRTLVTYKESLANTPIDPNDPTTWTGLWRDPRFSPPADGGRPENGLTGELFVANRGSSNITVPSAYGKLRLWRNTAVANLAAGQSLTLGNPSNGSTILGYEWDTDVDNPNLSNGGPAARPAGLFDVSSTAVTNADLLTDYGSTTSGPTSTATHQMTMYRAASGALVFGAGTVQWSWGLDTTHDTSPDTGPTTPDVNMQQATVNLLADMHAQPGSLQSGLVAANASSDAAAPSSQILTPTSGTIVTVGSTVTVSGAASDTGGGVVAGVEVSVDGGTTWHPASGATNWTYSWTANAGGTWTVKSRAVDDSGNLETPSAGATVTVTGDTTPPTISNVVTGTVTASSATVSWTTNKPATTQVQYGPSSAYGYAAALNSNLVTAHTQTISGLAAGTTYHFRVVSQDQVGNLATSTDATFTTSVPAASIRVGDSNLEGNADSDGAGAAEAFQYNATTSGTANRLYLYVDRPNLATSLVVGLYNDNGGDPGTLLTSGTITSPNAGSWNAVNVPGVSIAGGTPYWIAVLAPTGKGTAAFRDVTTGAKTETSLQTTLSSLPATWSNGGNWANSPLSAYAAQIGSSSDTQPPSISISAPTTGATVTGSNVTVSATATDNVGVTGVQFLIDGSPLGSTITAAPYSVTWNTTTVANGAHTIGAQATDGAGNVGTATTVGLTVSNPPVISAVSATNTSTTQATIIWATNESATSQVDYGLTNAYGSSTTLDNTLVSSHSQTITGLSANATYHFRVRSKDSAGNLAVSGDFTFVANGTPPTIAAVAASSITSNSATITWTTNVASTSQVDYGTTTTYGTSTVKNTSLVTSHSQTLTSLAGSTLYHFRVDSADSVGNLASSADFTFTTLAPPNCPCTIWPNTSVPTNQADNDTGSVEVGVKFQTDTAGFITGVRFYKGSTNTGSHIGNLWSSTGALLATATFSNETSTGWQSVTFPNAVAVNAGTTYVASYFAPVGHYAADANYFSTAGVDNSPLHALSNSAGSGNGVYAYNSTSTFPNQTFGSTNYWVDVSYSLTAPTQSPPTITNVQATNISNTGATITWTTNVGATSQVDYGTTASYGTSTTKDATLVASHSQTLSGLSASTLYHYRVDSGNGAGSSSSTDFTFTTAAPLTCPCSIWPTTATPTNSSANDSSAYELGVKFKSDSAGYITGVRFYKGSGNTGTHIGNLWSSGGTLLASGTFSGETASGWQTLTFPNAVAITTNTTYVASYFDPAGHYAADANTFATAGVDSAPLHALSTTAGNGNGVFISSSTSAFPTQTFNATNYWVDVVFNTTAPAPVPPTISNVQASGISSSGATITWSTNEISDSQVSYGTTTSYGTSTPVNSTLVTSHSVALSGLTAGTLYHYQAKSKDLAGLIGSSADFTFTTTTLQTCPCSIWPGTAIPANPSANDSSGVEIGVKFTSDTSGYITGIRFYKGTGNTGTHVGNLWSSTGTALARATFTNETASGWQQVTFSSPVAITANTTYIASYYAPAGHYPADANAFATAGVDNAPLHALSNTAASGNGVYAYSASTTFPNQTFSSTNYWVDVVFKITLP